ncbi:MAG: bifunctional glutamate N-acetyltransferase/amino-acid acetyltransferase ArgJ [Clostridia bacterium]|nr:bifunctional glutamate N-acetyltransferase/amino-acid acetyltransferase ArgJ [Clostridia bacterium]
MKVLANKTITDVPGILASGIASGIKKDGKKDLSVIYSKYNAAAAAVFTTNRVKGAPILVSMENIQNENTRAIIVNSGNANSCTGEEGIANAYKMVATAAGALNISPKEVLIQSTGALAIQIPMDIVIPGIGKACSSLTEQGGFDAAEAILTTDTRIKTHAVEYELGGKTVRMAGIAKGSTMIHPNMATMFSCVVTNASIAKPMLVKALKTSIQKSYHMISVDGDTSTNDMAVVLANGEAGNTLIDCENEEFKVFQNALDSVNIELAKMIAKDGEGSTKLLEIEVIHGKSVKDAERCARSVASSNLVKCAMFGSYPACPDILCALGNSGADFTPENVDLFLKNGNSQLQLVKNAMNENFDENLVKSILSKDLVTLVVDLKGGEGRATAWGCDMGFEYVKANAYLK